MSSGSGVTTSRRSKAGLLSSARSFFLPVGPSVGADSGHGYYIDMRVKTRAEPASRLHVDVIQYGLGAFERYVAGDGDEWLGKAMSIGERLLATQTRCGQLRGAWLHEEPFPHTFRLPPPWASAMAQGEGASLLARLSAATGRNDFAECAQQALLPLEVPSSEKGVRAMLDGEPFPEEYPTTPPSFVLNGAIFALWGYLDVGRFLHDGQAAAAYEKRITALASSLHRWDTGYWSRYDLRSRPMPNVASSFYHSLHINQLTALEVVSPRPGITEVRDRFVRYVQTPSNARRALVAKALFRVALPRNKRFRWWLSRA